MSRPYYRWTPRVANDMPGTVLAPMLACVRVHEPDEGEAAQAILRLLGITLEPCCEPDGEPCPSCAAEMEAEAVDRLIDMRRDEDALRGKP